MQTNEVDTGIVEDDDDVLSNLRSKSLMGVQIEVTISVGKTRLALSELIKLEKDSVLRLDSLIDDPVDLFYLTGLTLSLGVLLVSSERVILFVDGQFQTNFYLVYHPVV